MNRRSFIVLFIFGKVLAVSFFPERTFSDGQVRRVTKMAYLTYITQTKIQLFGELGMYIFKLMQLFSQIIYFCEILMQVSGEDIFDGHHASSKNRI